MANSISRVHAAYTNEANQLVSACGVTIENAETQAAKRPTDVTCKRCDRAFDAPKSGSEAFARCFPSFAMRRTRYTTRPPARGVRV